MDKVKGLERDPARLQDEIIWQDAYAKGTLERMSMTSSRTKNVLRFLPALRRNRPCLDMLDALEVLVFPRAEGIRPVCVCLSVKPQSCCLSLHLYFNTRAAPQRGRARATASC